MWRDYEDEDNNNVNSNEHQHLYVRNTYISVWSLLGWLARVLAGFMGSVSSDELCVCLQCTLYFILTIYISLYICMYILYF